MPLKYFLIINNNCIRRATNNLNKEEDDNSHDEDGGGDKRGGEETSVAVCVFPLPLMHLTSAVITASTHAETRGYDGSQDHKHDANARTK